MRWIDRLFLSQLVKEILPVSKVNQQLIKVNG